MAKKSAKKEHKVVKKVLKKGKTCIAFWIGIVAVIILALLKSLNVSFASGKWVFLVLLILGVIIGIVKLKDKNRHHMEVSLIALIVIMSMIPTLLQVFGQTISNFVMNLLIYFITLVVPAVAILAIINMFVFFKKR